MNLLTVNDVLQHPLFKEAEWVAGKKGETRHVRWLHIMEVIDFSTLLHGQEMILTTGAGLVNNEVSSSTYIKELVDGGASCLCIELGTYIDHIEPEMIATANEYDFPLIVFYEQVRFIDLSQTINSTIVNVQHQNLKELDEVSQQLQFLTTKPNGYVHIVKFLHERLNLPVIYCPVQDVSFCYPSAAKTHQPAMKEHLHEAERDPMYTGSYYAYLQQEYALLQPIVIMGRVWGIIGMILPHAEKDELLSLMLDRASLAIANHLLRTKYQEEQKLHQEQAWVNELIHKKIPNEKQALAKIGELAASPQPFSYRMFVLSTTAANPDSLASSEDGHYHLALTLRNYFERKGCKPFICRAKSYQLAVLVIQPGSQAGKIPDVTDLQAALNTQNVEDTSYEFGFSQPYVRLTEAHSAFEEAEQIIQYRQMSSRKPSAFFEQSGVYQLLLNMKDDTYIKRFIDQQLDAIRTHEVKAAPYLLDTLKVYLKNHCVKIDTAKELHIARQTLYHRLDKIEMLLGFKVAEEPQQRLALEVALEAYELYN